MQPQVPHLFDEARAWLAEDPDPETRRELQALLEARDEAAVLSRFGERLEFGTAGIRGVLGAGPGRMNRALVRRVTAGLARTVLEMVPNASERGVAIGFDGRRLSAEMAEDTAAVLAGRGIRVHWLGGPHPTPLLAYSVLELAAAAGVMITASHNPPEYNGYKVYWDNGAQIVPPLDAHISEAISAFGSLRDVPWLDAAEARARGLLVPAPADLEVRYLAALEEQALVPALPLGAAERLGVVYTPLHGTGRRLAVRALAARGLTRVACVPEQAEPDGRFPTVRFPNPEEPGALDLALGLARSEGAALVLANDPDADRLAVAVRHPGQPHRYEPLSGDQLGVLLAYHILERRSKSGRLPDGGFVVTTIVSSTLLDRMAAAYGVRCERTLTGFKWICNRALDLERRGGTFLYGYEEALGYCVGRAVRDKDGIGAAAMLAELAGEAAGKDLNLLDRLEEVYRRFGLFLTRQLSVSLQGAEGQRRMRATLERLRTEPPAELGGRRLLVLTDLHTGLVLDRRTGQSGPAELPPSDVLILELDQDCRVTLRPSGTEPKLKVYLEAREEVAADEPLEAAQARASSALDALEAAVRTFL
jgi:phosphomannomutase